MCAWIRSPLTCTEMLSLRKYVVYCLRLDNVVVVVVGGAGMRWVPGGVMAVVGGGV